MKINPNSSLNAQMLKQAYCNRDKKAAAEPSKPAYNQDIYESIPAEKNEDIGVIYTPADRGQSFGQLKRVEDNNSITDFSNLMPEDVMQMALGDSENPKLEILDHYLAWQIDQIMQENEII